MSDAPTLVERDTEKSNGHGAADPSGSAARRSGLPRLGSGKPKASVRREVELVDMGASVVLQKPTVAALIELQEAHKDLDDSTLTGQFHGAVALVAALLVEPDMGEEELRTQVEQMSPSDWDRLQDAAMQLSGMREEVEPAARADFPESAV